MFLGFTNYYREFLLDFVKMTAGLNAVKAKKIIEWNENQVHCFNSVKTIFTQAPCQASPDFSVHSKLFIFTIDFSKVAVGAVLSQKERERTVFRG